MVASINNQISMPHPSGQSLLLSRTSKSPEDSHIYVDGVYVSIDLVDSVVYAGTGGYGMYRLDPATKKWHNLGRTLGGGWGSAWERRMYQFSSILFYPDTPEKVYYGHFPGGFFISEDNGHIWVDSSLGLGNDGMFSLSMHPYDHNILFAGTYNEVVKSVDRGRTWQMKSSGMPEEQWPNTVAIDGDNPRIMYASIKNGQNKDFCARYFYTWLPELSPSPPSKLWRYRPLSGVMRRFRE